MRHLAGDADLEAAQVARVAIEKSQRLERRVEDVAGGFEHRERFAMREHARGAPRRHRRREDVEVAADPAQAASHARRAAAIGTAVAHAGGNYDGAFAALSGFR